MLTNHDYYEEWRNIPANTRRWTNDGLRLAHRLRRWANLKPSLFKRVVFAGIEHVRFFSEQIIERSLHLLNRGCIHGAPALPAPHIEWEQQ